MVPVMPVDARMRLDRHRIVFIGGLHRSGTTLLTRCLGQHASISGFRDTGVPMDEGMFLQSVYKPARFYGGPGRFAFHPQAHLTETSQLVSPENHDRIWVKWAKHWDLEKSHLLEKSPPNLIRTRFLQGLFPNSYFIILIRHPIPVSYATKKWSKSRFYSLMNHWIAAHEIFDDDAKYLNRLLVLRYEDFVRTPESILNHIYGFLGLDSHPCSESIRKDLDSGYFARWENLRRNAFLNLRRLFLIWRYEDKVRNFGYSLRDVRWTPTDSEELTLKSLRVRRRFRDRCWNTQDPREPKIY